MATKQYETWPVIQDHDGWLGGIVDRLRTRWRRARAETFLETFELSATTRVLDLGGGNGVHIHSILRGSPVKPVNTYIADVDKDALKICARYGFTAVVIDESGRLPFPDRFFDVVFCSSVIEHVTALKEQIWNLTSGARFQYVARQHQQEFAKELVRVGKGYFIQVPYRWFPIESHTWLPFFSYLPRRAQIPLMRLTNRFWIKQSIPDFHLLTESEMSRLFPDARILREKVLGFTKSLIAYRRNEAVGTGPAGQLAG